MMIKQTSQRDYWLATCMSADNFVEPTKRFSSIIGSERMGLSTGRLDGSETRWLVSFEQLGAIAKWSVCRFHTAARNGWLR